jgi:hypothetical protein
MFDGGRGRSGARAELNDDRITDPWHYGGQPGCQV